MGGEEKGEEEKMKKMREEKGEEEKMKKRGKKWEAGSAKGSAKMS
ncbi:Uncharacterised protein [Scardovia inopinata]|uniref:Uncharacterized protein n=1 Tax=Scardovia inopinata F0304 TaxID=641146 RepID=W1MX90_SCAIO|nr:hypothetical protein [Scardovia inopinata]EQW13377.1 hypothetical protein HMPREF9020_01555 [Scardovia inopinata F0304]SUV51245.1 Uncharacterised protein [Scardovia inopinata]